jgi:hypothetical protein
MKKLLLGLVLLSGQAMAADTYQTTFNIIGLRVGADSFIRMKLDVELTARYVRANGGLVYADGISESPMTGTCFVTGGLGLYCNLQVDQNSYELRLDQNLSGSILVKGPDGFIIDSGEVLLSDIR